MFNEGNFNVEKTTPHGGGESDAHPGSDVEGDDFGEIGPGFETENEVEVFFSEDEEFFNHIPEESRDRMQFEVDDFIEEAAVFVNTPVLTESNEGHPGSGESFPDGGEDRRGADDVADAPEFDDQYPFERLPAPGLREQIPDFLEIVEQDAEDNAKIFIGESDEIKVHILNVD